MKILLAYPPVLRAVGLYSTPLPLGLLQVGSFLRGQGHEVRALNLELGGSIRTVSIQRMRQAYADTDALDYVNNPKSDFRVQFRQAVSEFRPDLIGLSCATEQINAGRRLSEDARSLLPGIRIEYGDIRRQSSSWVRDVSAAALPADPALDLLLGQNPPESFGLLLTSTGCPRECAFCGSPMLYRRQVTPLPMDAVERRVRQAMVHGASRFNIADDSLTSNVSRAVQIADLMGRIGLPWQVQAQAEDIVRQPQLVDYFRRNGCVQVTFGAESGSPAVLGLMRKAVEPEQFLRAGEILDRAAMPYAASFMIGYPGETNDDAGMTMSLIERLAPWRVQAGSVVPYHGTRLHDSRPDVVAEAGKWPFCRWSPYDPQFLCDRRGRRFAGPDAATVRAFYKLVESINTRGTLAGASGGVLVGERTSERYEST